MSRARSVAECHSESNGRRMSQLGQQSNGQEPEDWICYPCEWILDSSNVDRRSSSVVSIFRVPNVLITDSEKREAYVPTRVSLGPYHNRAAELRPMDIRKRRALQRMINRRFNLNVRNLSGDPKSMDFYNRAKDEILRPENKVRDNYEEKLECEEETLAQMLCLDGCFIIEILRTRSRDVRADSKYYEPIFKAAKIYSTASDIVLDILKLENQVPLIVLQKLLELELNSAEDVENIMLKEMILSLFWYFYPFDDEIDVNKWSWPQRVEEKVHLLGLLHTLILFSERGQDEENIMLPLEENKPHTLILFSERGRDEENIPVPGYDPDKHITINDIANIPRAIKLRNAGIKFKRCNGGIKEINFDSKSGTIYLPCIIITDSTEIVFRNLIAFEMCNSSGDDINYVACYVALMDQLINTEEDVALLRKRGIVTNYLGSDKEVAELFKDLCKGVAVSLDNVFNQLKLKVNRHYTKNWNAPKTKWNAYFAKLKTKWNGYFAKLRSEYFSSPWSIIALLSAFALLVLTLLQTIFTIKK